MLISALSLCSPFAAATPFFGLIVDSGNEPGSLGLPIAPSFGTFFQHPAGNNFPPYQFQIWADPTVAFDSYIALGGMPTNSGNRANAPFEWARAAQAKGVFSPNPQGPSNALASTWFTLPPQVNRSAQSGPSPAGPESVFVARLTVKLESTIIGARVFVAGMVEGSTEPVSAYATVNGPSRPVSGSFGGTTLGLRAVRTAQADLPGFGPADVYDLYLVNDAPISSAPEVPGKPPAAQPKIKTPAAPPKGEERAIVTPDPRDKINPLPPKAPKAGKAAPVKKAAPKVKAPKKPAKKTGKAATTAPPVPDAEFVVPWGIGTADLPGFLSNPSK